MTAWIQRHIGLMVHADGTLCRPCIYWDLWSGAGRLVHVIERSLPHLRKISHKSVIITEDEGEASMELLPDGRSEQDLLDAVGAGQEIADKHQHLAQNPHPLP